MRQKLLCLILFLPVCLLSACATPAEKKKAEAPNVHYILGVSYLREDDPTRALQEFQKAQAINKHDPDIYVGLGRAYQLKGAFDEAEKQYLQALKIRPDHPLTENNLGSLYLEMQKPDEAIRYFSKASSNMTFNSAEVSYTGLGYAHFKKGEYLEAITAYQKALAHNKRYAQAYLRLGEVYYSIDKPERAIDELRRALEIDDNFLFAHFQLGLAYMKLDNVEKARQSFQKVLQLAPHSQMALQAETYLDVLR